MAKNARDVAAKWASRLAASTAEITNGVNAVRESPGIAAANQRTKYLEQVVAKADKWESRLRSLNVETWRKAVIDKGIPRISNGANNAKPKMEAFLNEFLPYIDLVTDAAKNFPTTTLQDRINKMIYVVDGLSKFKRRGQ